MIYNTKLNNNKLLICINDWENLDHITSSIQTLFGDIIDVIAIHPSKLYDLDSDFSPVAAIVTYLTIKIVGDRFQDTILILQQRDLSGQALEKVVSLPANSNALIVNKPFSCAEETVDNLKELGINHIIMTPYAPGSKIDSSSIDTIIYTGIKEECPKLDCQYIDIGLRKISLYTIIDIIRAFNLPSKIAKEYYIDNLQQFTSSCYHIDSALKQVNNLKNNFERISDMNNNITFVINENDEIILLNETANSYFDFKDPATIIGENYENVFSDYPDLLSYISSTDPISDTLINIKNQMLLISYFDMDVDKEKNKAYIMLPISVLQKRESLVRKKLKATGFVAKHTFEDILGSSDLMKQSKTLAKMYARTDFPILITGESGTGKELFAQSIHNASIRKEANFVAINFAALPETLAESELFGYAEGAFTGASKGGKIGMFELAHKGTIFLDEIGDASLPVQAKLLRVLEQMEVIKVGGVDVIPVDVRIICATNKNLEEAIHLGLFRQDLYYRIKILNLQLKPLRDRPEDIMDTMTQLLSGSKARCLANLPHLKNFLHQYSWPGNARELRTIAEYINMLSTLFSEKDAIDMLNLYLENNFTQPITSDNNKTPTPKDESIEVIPNNSSEYISEDLLAILKSIQTLQNQGSIAGRNSICKMPDSVRLNLTESKVKNRLSKLSEMGYISIGKTKQGVTLTNSGYQILMHYHK